MTTEVTERVSGPLMRLMGHDDNVSCSDPEKCGGRCADGVKKLMNFFTFTSFVKPKPIGLCIKTLYEC